ncbi:MAG: VWA domain-containing protein [Spirochaetes bacterium]|nr:VWA domain-containing protein [Spirochaetota bacterium]
MKKSVFAILLAFFLFTGLSLAGSDDIANVNIQSMDISEFPLVRIFYNTTDKSGKYQAGIPEDNVQVFEDKLYCKVWGDGDYSHAKSNIVMIIDSSGSMRGVMDKVLSAASNLLKEMDSGDSIMLVDFDSTVKPLTGFTRDKDELLNTLPRIKANGATALYDSISTGVNKLLLNPEKSGGLNLVVILTDGKDENAGGGHGSKITLSQLEIKLKAAGTPVYSIGLGNNVDKKTLETISRVSMGKTFYAKDTENLSAIYRDIIGYVHSLHKFEYITANGKWDGTERKVALYFKELKKLINLKYKALTKDRIAGTLNMSGNRVSNQDLKGADIKWSYCFVPFGGKSGRFVSSIAITPDGQFVFDGEVLGILNAAGERIFLGTYDSTDAFNINVSNHLYQYTHGYGYNGNLYNFDEVRKLADLKTIKSEKPEGINMPAINYPYLLSKAKGSFHKEWLGIDHPYKPVSISKNGRFIAFTASPDDQEYDYYFLVYDIKGKTILWENGVYRGDFGEPGAVKISENGFTLIIQDHNIFGVNSKGVLQLKLMWEKTGMRFSRIDINGSGNSFAGMYDYNHSTYFGCFNISDVKSKSGITTSLKPVFSVEAKPNDKPGCISISSNGQYLGFNDKFGPKIYDNKGNLLWSLHFKNEIYSNDKGNGFYIIDDGAFVFSEANRFFFGKLTGN